MAIQVSSTSSSKGVVASQQSVNTAEFAKKISSVDATQIERIAMDIEEGILPNLGAKGKSLVQQQVQQKQGVALSKQQQMLMQMQLALATTESKFLSDEQEALFTMAMLWSVKEAISKAFSTPLNFLDHGLSFKLSEYEPTEILKKTAEKIKVDINSTHVPLRYVITLRLDTVLSQEQSKLVFSITEISDRVELSKRTITIK